MKLVITSEYNQIVLTAGSLKKVIKLESGRALSQVFLKNLDSFLKQVVKAKIKLNGIAVSQTGPSFSSLRTMLTLANLLARQSSWPMFDLETGRKIKLALPKYSKQPNITKPKEKS